MATRDFTPAAYRLTHPASTLPLNFILTNEIDGASNAQASSDIAQMLDVKDGYMVMAVVLEVLTAEGATLTVDVGDGTDADGWLDGIDGNVAATSRSESLIATAVLDPISLVDGAGETLVIPVTGAKLGDFVRVASPLDVEDLTMTAYVASAGNVEVRLQNESTATVNIASGTWKAEVISGTELFGSRNGKFFTADDTIDILFNDAMATAVLRLKALCFDFKLAGPHL